MPVGKRAVQWVTWNHFLFRCCQAICVNGFSFLPSQFEFRRLRRIAGPQYTRLLLRNSHAPSLCRYRCGGKVGILFLDFQFSTAHQFFCFGSVLNANPAVVGAVEMWESRCLCEIPKAAWERWEACRWLSIVSTPPAFPPRSVYSCGRFTSFPLWEPVRRAESRSVARQPSSSAPASSTS